MMSGAGSGNTYTQSSLKNVTSWYDTSSNTWGTYTQSTIPITWDGGSGQIIPFNVTPLFNQLQGVSVATIVHNGSTTWTTAPQLSGGLRLDNANYINDAVTSSYPIFTANDSNWNQIMVAGSNHPNAQPRSFRAQAVRSENDRIWFFGGMQYNISTNGMPYTGQDVASDAVTFSSFPYMDNAAGYFNISYNSASNIPSTRYWHSATLLPGKGQILIFGGVYSGKACPDFAYLFDTNTLKWTQPNVVGASAQARYGHSAVMVGKNLLYIMFGADVSGNLLNRVDILNTTSWTFLDAGVNNSQSNGGSSGGGVPGGSSGMSVGTIAGIAVGVVVGVSKQPTKINYGHLMPFFLFQYLGWFAYRCQCRLHLYPTSTKRRNSGGTCFVPATRPPT
ncbi:hypothetical protein DM01DRAFT_1169846 [Hesseltinella vesiculosa]|uniref:Galactose oxidase n=1 Tax=Hesseltinella vesiculosa TaxID=101127 RepID=A0A1X2G5M2_9FUNG|nr:hypothetical protein DM01DRAFT_1169846 [Hesseltinella vesiculosa]